MRDLVIKGRIVTARSVLPVGYLVVRDGKVAGIGAEPPAGSRDVLDYGDRVIFPGAIDAHVHSRSQKGREGFAFSTRAAAAGGVTTIADMPYDEGFLVCNAEAVTSKAADIRRQAHVDVALHGTIDPSEGTVRIAEQVEAGVAGFKFSTFGTDPVRFPRINPQLMHDAFAEVARFGLVAGVHNENEEIVRGNIAAMKRGGRTDYLAHGLTHTVLAERLAMAEIYETGAATGCHAHVVHCSIGRGVEICEAYRRQGFRSSVEVCIHYLMFCEEEDVRAKIGLAKINPPIRPKREREALWRHLATGQIDLVSTDHVAWSLDRKNDPDMFRNSSGGPGLEALVPALIAGCEDRGIGLDVAARMVALNPARHFRLQGLKGALEIGCDADFSIIDLNRVPWRVSNSQTVSDWSLYEGMELPQVRETWLRGERIWDGTQVLNAAGSGTYVTPTGRR